VCEMLGTIVPGDRRCASRMMGGMLHALENAVSYSP